VDRSTVVSVTLTLVKEEGEDKTRSVSECVCEREEKEQQCGARRSEEGEVAHRLDILHEPTRNISLAVQHEISGQILGAMEDPPPSFAELHVLNGCACLQARLVFSRGLKYKK
jgi:hypothetical protein